MEGLGISGTVFSGLGLGASFMALEWVQKTLELRLGFKAYPATLNVRPDSADDLARWKQVQQVAERVEIIPPDASFCHALCFPVEVAEPSLAEKIRGAVLLPQVEDYPADKIEIIAPLNIKESLGVRDGSRLMVEFF